MKLLDISDVHGDLPVLESVKNHAQKREDLELIVCSGDFLGGCLSYEEGKKEGAAFGYIDDFVREHIQVNGGANFDSILKFILTDERVPKEAKQAARDHIELVKIFDKNAKEQYQKISEVFKQFPQQVLTVPGNWDSPHYFEFFEEQNIHNKTKEINGIKFAGYGGSNMVPVFLPYARHLSFDEETLNGFLTEEDPDVVISHVAPFGLQDKGIQRDHEGSWAYLSYIGRETPVLCLVGHSHEGRGISKDKDVKTFVINPGNLGHYEGSPNSGTFYEIELRKEGIISAVPYKIVNKKIVSEEGYVDGINGKGKIEKEASSGVIALL
ncbi:MAG: metallophosphoesterase [Nanoarchaeota archaeon]|nr:metallophosphoesterase [Nanoarchaeota archaeon]